MKLLARGKKPRSNRKKLGVLARLRGLFAVRRNTRRPRVDSGVGGAASEAAAEALAAMTPADAATQNRRTGRRDQGAGRPRWRFALTLVGWLLPAGVAVGAFVTPLLGVKAYNYVMETGHFHVRQVFVDGNQRVSYDDIVALTGLAAGSHVLKISTDELAERLEQHPWIARATVEKQLPDTLTIRLVEHQPVAYLALGELMLVNASGAPFAPLSPRDTADLPIINGIGPEVWADPNAREVAEADVRAAVNLANLYDHMGLGARWPISEIRLEAGRRFTLVLSDLGTEVVLGLGPYRDKLYRLEWVLENLRREGKAAEYVLLDGPAAGALGSDDGRVVVKADLAPTREELARQAAERAEAAAHAATQQGPPAVQIEDAGQDTHDSGGSAQGEEH